MSTKTLTLRAFKNRELQDASNNVALVNTLIKSHNWWILLQQDKAVKRNADIEAKYKGYHAWEFSGDAYSIMPCKSLIVVDVDDHRYTFNLSYETKTVCLDTNDSPPPFPGLVSISTKVIALSVFFYYILIVFVCL